MFSIGYGSKNREIKIREILKEEPSTAVILAAVHFEWAIKRAILKLGFSPTAVLRKKLEETYKISDPHKSQDYRHVWDLEVASRFKKENCQLGTVLGNLHKITSYAMKTRGKIVHGNGTVPKPEAKEAVDQFLIGSKKIRDFTNGHYEDIDTRLKIRKKERVLK